MRRATHAWVRDTKKEIKDTVKQAEWASADLGVQIAKEASSGLIDSTKEGRPYSRARPNPAFDPQRINVGIPGRAKRPGSFRDGWQRMGQSQGPGLENISEDAKYLEAGGKGDSRMTSRAIDVLVASMLWPVRKFQLDKAFRNLKK